MLATLKLLNNSQGSETWRKHFKNEIKTQRSILLYSYNIFVQKPLFKLFEILMSEG